MTNQEKYCNAVSDCIDDQLLEIAFECAGGGVTDEIFCRKYGVLTRDIACVLDEPTSWTRRNLRKLQSKGVLVSHTRSGHTHWLIKGYMDNLRSIRRQ